MGNYDAEVRIGTKVDTSQMQKLQYQIDNATNNVDRLTKHLEKLEITKTPTEEYVRLSAKIKETEELLERLIAKQKYFTDYGKENRPAFSQVKKQIVEAESGLATMRAEMQELVNSGRDFRLNDEEIKKTKEELVKAESELKRLLMKQEELSSKSIKVSDGFRKVSDGLKRIGSIGAKAFSGVNHHVRKSNGLLGTFTSKLKGMALSLLIFNWISKGFNAMVSGMKDGFKNLVQYSDEYNRSISSLQSANAQLKNSFAAAFAPIVQMIIPYLVQLIGYVTTAMNTLAQFMAILSGASTWTKATAVQKNYAASLKGTASAAKKAAGALASFDEIEVLSKKDDSGSGAGEVDPSQMFEEIPIDNEFLEFAEKLKDIFSKLFNPLKKAWDRVGKQVIDAWKYALDEVWKLIKDIGRDFLTMWNQEATIKMFEDILLIIADIGLIIGNLAENFRMAWNENEAGLHILENIRDIFAVIIENIRLAADKTVEWAKNINFSPLLTKIEEWTASLVPVFDNLSGIITDFYTQVLLALGKWVLEKGLPDLLQVFIDFNEKVDWESLRTNLSEFWKHLEPFAENVGEGLILFIERVSDNLSDFVNSEEFDAFLTAVGDWMDNVDAGDVADALELIATALITLKVALLGFSTISAITDVFTTVKTFLSFFCVGGEASGVATTMTEISTAASRLSTALGYLATAGAGFATFDLGIKNKAIDLMEWITKDTETADVMRERYGQLGGTVSMVTDVFDVANNTLKGYGPVISDTSQLSKALGYAFEKIGDGAIYSDEQLDKLKEEFGATDDDIEMLRQSMLDANEPLRELADNFGLFDASAETLSDIQQGMELIESGILDASDAYDFFSGKMGKYDR